MVKTGQVSDIPYAPNASIPCVTASFCQPYGKGRSADGDLPLGQVDLFRVRMMEEHVEDRRDAMGRTSRSRFR